MQAIRVHDGAIRIVEVAMWGPAIRAGRAWHVKFTVVHGLDPEASFDEGDELLIGESTPEFRICDEKRSTILLAREQPRFGLRAGDMAGDTFVAKLVCSDSELALIRSNSVYQFSIFLGTNDFRTLQPMCYKLRKHEDSTGEISARRP